MSKVYEIVQTRIIEQLEEAIENGGTAPWRKPWKGGIPRNYITKKAYRGINLMMLEGGSYLTFNQIKDLQKKNPKVKLKKGSKSHMIFFWSFPSEPENEEEEERRGPIFKFYRVFSIRDVEELEEEQIFFETDPVEQAENLLKEYGKECRISNVTGGGRAYYSANSDSITLPSIKQFENVNEYYSTAFHEIIHSTGHESRLNRFNNTDQFQFGSESYSKEELVAEIGSNMLLAMIGIEDDSQQENSVSYLHSWLSKIKEDTSLILYASQRAQKASDFVLEVIEGSNIDEKQIEPQAV